MQQTGQKSEISQKIRILQMVSLCILFAAAFLGTLPHLGLLPPPPSEVSLIKIPVKEIFYFLAAANIIAGTILRKFLFKVQPQKGSRPDPEKFFRSYFTASIVAFAFYESVSIFGFVLYMLTGDKELSMLFTFISIAAMLFQWPKERDFEQSLIQ